MASEEQYQEQRKAIREYQEVLQFLQEHMKQRRAGGSARWTGQASNALIEIALNEFLNGDKYLPEEFLHYGPSDLSDLAACIRACDRAPECLTETMWRVLWGWWSDIARKLIR